MRMKMSLVDLKIWRDWLTWMNQECCIIFEGDMHLMIFMWVCVNSFVVYMFNWDWLWLYLFFLDKIMTLFMSLDLYDFKCSFFFLLSSPVMRNSTVCEVQTPTSTYTIMWCPYQLRFTGTQCSSLLVFETDVFMWNCRFFSSFGVCEFPCE
jgi:hypothetical protein